MLAAKKIKDLKYKVKKIKVNINWITKTIFA